MASCLTALTLIALFGNTSVLIHTLGIDIIQTQGIVVFWLAQHALIDSLSRHWVLQALGIAILGVGIWAVVQEQNYSFVTDNDIASGGAILIAAGAVTLIITFVGILGAIFKWRPLLILVS